MTQFDFANKYQRAAGLSLTAADYLRLERSRGIALTIGAAQSAERGNTSPATVDAIAGEVIPPASETLADELSRLTTSAAPAAMEMNYSDPAVKELAAFMAENFGHGSAGRLARHLGWPL